MQKTKSRKKAPTRLARERILPLGTPNPIDVHVGSRVRLRRTLMGLSQEKLGEEVNLTFQQIQKYERGANRIGSSRLYEFAQILDVPVSFFFDDMPSGAQNFADQRTNGKTIAKPSKAQDPDPMVKRETLELVRAYYKIIDPSVRKSLVELMRAAAKSEAVED